MPEKGYFSNLYYDRAVELLKKVCVIPAPSHHEDRRVSFIMQWLEKEGIRAETDDAKNVIIPYIVDPDAEYDVFAAHTDVVFPDTEDFEMRIDGNRLHCPGSGDDSANFVALLMYALWFFSCRPQCCTNVLFVCNSCEEGLGNLHGVRTLFENYSGRIRSFTSFDTILGRGIVNTAVGSERYEISVHTQGGHSFVDFGQKNAIAILSSVITKLYGQSTDSRMTTYNVGTINGGTSVNSIAQDASCTYEYRAVSEESLMKMKTRFENIINTFKARNVDIRVKCIGCRPCAHNADTLWLESAAERVLKRYSLSTVRGVSSTDCNIPLSLGIPAICFGLIYAEGTHTRQEMVDLDSYRCGLDTGFEYILEVIGTKN